MLKWTLGHKLPTPGPLGAVEGPKRQSDGDDNLHFAKRRRSTGAVRKASVRALRRRFEENKENEQHGVRKKLKPTRQHYLEILRRADSHFEVLYRKHHSRT